MSTQPLRVLLVEGDDGDACRLREVLRELPRCSLARAPTCADALAELARSEYDVALVDVDLPDRRGLDTTRALAGAAPRLPIIVLTGRDDEELAVEALRAGCQDYLRKTEIRVDVLEHAMRSAIERKRVVLRLEHVDRVLTATRSINQLVIRERNARTQVERACSIVVGARGYDAAWLVLFDRDRRPATFACDGTGGDYEAFERSWRDGKVPDCVSRVLASSEHDALAVPACAGGECPLHASCGARGAIIAPLRHGSDFYGLLCVGLPVAIMATPDEIELVAEVADDLGFGLHASVLAAERTETHARYRDLYDHAPDMYLSVDVTTGAIIECNQTAVRMLGYGRDELVGRSMLELYHPASRPGAERVLQALAIAGDVRDTELQIVRKDGMKLDVNLNATAVRDAGGRLRVVRASLTDITDRKRLLLQIAQADRLASVGTLAAGVAHEINNPLAAVMANLDFVALELAALARASSEASGVAGSWDGGPALDPPMRARLAELDEPLRDAREAAHRVRQIVRDLKVLSRPEDERTGPVNVNAVLESTLRMCWNEIRHRARLVKELGTLSPVEANEARLGQVFINLVVNAAQAIPEGAAEANEIHVSSQMDEAGRIVIEVRDTGCGIPEENLSKIFHPFFTTKPPGMGTGLGLAICSRILASIGGELSLESIVGKGSRFRVVLPSMESSVVPVRRRMSTPAPARRRGRILVIDDDPAIGKVVRRLLGAEHQVLITESGRDGLRLLQSGERFDVILCDLMMPDVTGMDVHAELLVSAPEQAAQIVFITGGVFTERARAFLDYCDNQRLEKPFDASHLRAFVNDRVR